MNLIPDYKSLDNCWSYLIGCYEDSENKWDTLIGHTIYDYLIELDQTNGSNNYSSNQ